MRARCSRLLLLVALVFAIGALAPTASAQDATPGADSPTQSSREVLNSGLPGVAPGFELVLTRVVIPPGAVTAAHVHPGMQVVFIESGTIHYTVVSGDVPFIRAGTPVDGTEGTLYAGEETDFGPGDRLTELPGMVHIAENHGDTPVVILGSALLPVGVPTSIPVPYQATPEGQ